MMRKQQREQLYKRVCAAMKANPDMTAAELAERFGVDHGVIVRIAQRFGLTLPTSSSLTRKEQLALPKEDESHWGWTGHTRRVNDAMRKMDKIQSKQRWKRERQQAKKFVSEAMRPKHNVPDVEGYELEVIALALYNAALCATAHEAEPCSPQT